MKATSLLALLFGGMISAALAADAPAPLDLDGRQIIVRVSRNWPKAPVSYEKVTATIKGRIIRPDVNDANDSTAFYIYREDHQRDQVLRIVLEQRTYGWSFKEDGPQYYLPVSSAELDGRKVIVRLYNSPYEDPPVFDQRVAVADGRLIELSFPDAKGSTFVVIFGADQKDVVIRKLLGNAVFGWTYQKKLKFSLPMKPAGDTGQHYWTILDALDDPVSNAAVKALLAKQGRELVIASGTTDSRGQFPTSFALPDLRAFWPSQKGPARARFRFVISHPAYGAAIVEPYPGVRPEWLYVPLVQAGSEADERSIWGVVVDQNDKPVEGAFVRAGGVVAVGAKGVPAVSSQEHAVLTDQDGRFRTYVPIAEHVDQIGILIPPKAKYWVRIEPPPGQDLAPFRGHIPNGRHSKIMLEFMGYFRTFAFEDENGSITDPKRLEDIEVIIQKKGQGNDIWLSYPKWKDGGEFPLGKYEARSWRYAFQPLQVTADSPRQLVFRLPPARTYYGRVVNGITGERMSGASVRLSREGPVSTDQNGRFEVTVLPKAAADLIFVSKQDYLKVRILKGWIEKDDRGRYQLPEVKLFPAATVTVEPVGAKHHKFPMLFFRPQWFLVGQDNPHWAQDLLAACGEHPQDGIYRDIRIGGRDGYSFPVPAGVPLRINLRVLGNIEWAPVTIADNVLLEHAEVLDLGQHQMSEPFKVFVEVLDSQGASIEGVPVIACGQHDPAVSSSDENGFAFFDFVGYSKGEFIVEYRPTDDANAAPLRQTIPYEVRGVQDANSVYTLQVSDEMLYHLFE